MISKLLNQTENKKNRWKTLENPYLTIRTLYLSFHDLSSFNFHSEEFTNDHATLIVKQQLSVSETYQDLDLPRIRPNVHGNST